MKEQWLRTKKVNAKKVNTAKTPADRSCKNLLTPCEQQVLIELAINSGDFW
jgi:hypothetical protein